MVSYHQAQQKGSVVQVRTLALTPGLVMAATALGLLSAPAAAADCNTVTSSTLCASGGTVKGSSGAPTSVPSYNPYPCYGSPACDYYDVYNPGIIFDLPNLGFGGGNRPQPR